MRKWQDPCTILKPITGINITGINLICLAKTRRSDEFFICFFFVFFREIAKYYGLFLFSWNMKYCNVLLEVRKVTHRLWYYLLHQEWGSCIPAERGAAGREWCPSGRSGSSRTARQSSSQTEACGSTWNTNSGLIISRRSNLTMLNIPL